MLFGVDTDRGGASLNTRTAYVGPTRGRTDIRVYCNDKERMVRDFSRDVSHRSAIEHPADAEAAPCAGGRARMKALLTSAYSVTGWTQEERSRGSRSRLPSIRRLPEPWRPSSAAGEVLTHSGR
jgi:hypothetical protein